MKLAVEYDLETHSEANMRGASIGAMRAKADRIKRQREATKAVLVRHFGAVVPPLHLCDGGRVRANKFGITITRIAPRELDDDNIGQAIKAVRDEAAAWCGVPNDRDPIYTWTVPAPQERPAQEVYAERWQFVYRVRIEICDARPGADRNVVETETASEGRLAASRVRGEVRKAIKKSGTDPHAGKNAQRRDRGEERPAREMAACSTCGAGVGAACRRIGQERLIFGVHEARAKAAGLHVPADDRARVKPARAHEYRCPFFDSRPGQMFCAKHGSKCPEPIRKVATVPGQARLVARRCLGALPWEQNPCGVCTATNFPRAPGDPRCSACEGTGQAVRKLAPLPQLDGLDVPREAIEMRVPGPHVQRWGLKVTLHRRERVIAGVGTVWLYVYQAT